MVVDSSETLLLQEPKTGILPCQEKFLLNDEFSLNSESRMEISELTLGHQYWIRVRAIRGTDSGSWSDPATRIANV